MEFVVTVTKKSGPLIEYERRIANGELVDGDSCQVMSVFQWCIIELMKLFSLLWLIGKMLLEVVVSFMHAFLHGTLLGYSNYVI